MPKSTKHLLHTCLYFTANSLARKVSRMAEEEFRPTGLSPSLAFLLMLVNEEPGITQKELASHLNLAPSTVTRFVDTLSSRRGLIERRTQGKSAGIYPTDKGKEMQDLIAQCWQSLYHRYSQILGEQSGCELTGLIDRASQKIE